MLEGFLRTKAEKRGLVLHVESAGTHWSAKKKMSPSLPTYVCMRKRGIDVSSYRSRHLDEIKDLSRFDLVIAVTPEIAFQVTRRNYVGTLYVVDVPNPFGRNVATYETCAALLEQIAENIVGAL